jgi:IS30 family transposase
LPRGELRKELMKGLRQERKQKLFREAIYCRRQRIEDMISISERPKEVEDRIVPRHWEGDLIVGKNHNSARHLS